MAAALDGEFELVAGAFASSPERSREQGQLLGLDASRIYANYEQMANGESELPENERIEAVAVVTPNHLHYPAAKSFLEAGICVICDKPMTTSVTDAEDLCRVAEETGMTLALTYNYTGYPLVKEARHRVEKGELGTIRKVVAEYSQGWLSTPLERASHKQAEWRLDPERAGPSSAMADIGSHLHHLVCWVTGLDLETVFGEISTLVPGRKMEDDATVLVRFRGGARGLLSVSQVAIGEENGLHLRIYGSRGALDWRQENPNRMEIFAQNRRQVVTRGMDDLCAATRYGTRLPTGHPEGFIEAFANLYRSAGRVIGARIKRMVPDPLDLDVPNQVDGLRGAQFIENVLRSSTEERWVEMTDGSGREEASA